MFNKAALRSDRMNEILTQVAVPYSFFAMVLNLQPGRHRFTFELMATAFRLSTVISMQFKHHFRVRRPADRTPLIQPVLLTPGHGSYPGGHGAQGYLVAAMLKDLIGATAGSEKDVQLTRLADRISENRVIAGLHYPEDMVAGGTLGDALAKHLKDRAKLNNSAVKWLWGKAKGEWS